MNMPSNVFYGVPRPFHGCCPRDRVVKTTSTCEPRREETGFLYMRKQRRRSASR